MTTQEAYENIRAHFTGYGAKLAKDVAGMCKYRTADGQKCAVGAIIPDELYSPAIEQNSLNRLLDGFVMPPQGFGLSESKEAAAKVTGFLYGVDRRFLLRAQALHDRSAGDARQFVVMLDLLAEASGLSPVTRQGV